MSGKRYRHVAGVRPSRQVSRTFWRLLRGALGYGLLLSVSISTSKAVMCAICTNYLTYIRPASFWILHGFVTLLLLLISFALIRCVRTVFFNQGGPKAPYDTLLYRWQPKTTRSGTVYGYM